MSDLAELELYNGRAAAVIRIGSEELARGIVVVVVVAAAAAPKAAVASTSSTNRSSSLNRHSRNLAPSG